MTRPFGEAPSRPVSAPAAVIVSLRRIQTFGVVGVVGGLGLLVSVLAHWPGSAQPEPDWFAVIASNLAVALLAVGTTASAFGVRELEGRWSLGALVPGFNLFVASALVNRRLGLRPGTRVLSEVTMLALFAVAARHDAWLGVAPVVVAYLELSWFSALITRLSAGDPAPGTPRA
jgi:hypothetical protein